MDFPKNVLLQINDSVTTKRATLRIESPDLNLPVGQLLNKYLKNASIPQLCEDGRITKGSAETLTAIQDLVYASSDQGLLVDMFPGIAFKRLDRFIDLDQVILPEVAQVDEKEVSIINLTIDRINLGYDRNWIGFHRRRWHSHADQYEAFVRSTLERNFGQSEVDTLLQLDSREHKLKLLQALARRIWESDFENYSRFIGEKLIFKSGDETLRNILGGSGGICSEKVQALKFITDHYGLDSEYLIAGDNALGPVPVNKLREMLKTFDFRLSKRYMRFWQHTALLYNIDGTLILVDATNGNIPFLFLLDDQAERVLGYRDKVPIKVRMVESEENFYYHRVPQDIPENLFFALEGWIPDADMLQVFDNELGLYLSKQFYLAPIPYRNEREFEKLRQEYHQVCRRAGLKCEVNHEWTFDSPLGQEFVEADFDVSQKIYLAKEHLLRRYNEWDRPDHDAGLVIIKLQDG